MDLILSFDFLFFDQRDDQRDDQRNLLLFNPPVFLYGLVNVNFFHQEEEYGNLFPVFIFSKIKISGKFKSVLASSGPIYL